MQNAKEQARSEREESAKKNKPIAKTTIVDNLRTVEDLELTAKAMDDLLGVDNATELRESGQV